MRSFRIAFRLSGFFAALIVFVPPQLILMFVPRLRFVIPLLFFRSMLKLIGVRLAMTGPMPKAGTLLVANHMSWFDIIIIGAIMPLSFIAKSEVKSWPLFGQLALLQNTVFVDRRRGRHAIAEKNTIADRLRQGDNIVLFAEGTSTDGLRVLPFKSTLFASVEGLDAVSVQAMTMAYSRLHNMAMGRRQRMAYGWIGEMTLLPHFFFMLGGPPLTVDIVFHPPLKDAAALSRKKMAHMLYMQVSHGLDAITRGSPHPVSAAQEEGSPPPHRAMAAHDI